jgi:hypothetical protein
MKPWGPRSRYTLASAGVIRSSTSFPGLAREVLNFLLPCTLVFCAATISTGCGTAISASPGATISPSQALVVDSNLDNSTNNLSTCVKPFCNPSGNPAGPTAVSSQVVTTTPCGAPSDGKALQLRVSGPDYVNALWSYKMPAVDEATRFRLDFDACFDSSIVGSQAFEADIALFVSGNPGWNYMFGGQCDLEAESIRGLEPVKSALDRHRDSVWHKDAFGLPMAPLPKRRSSRQHECSLV